MSLDASALTELKDIITSLVDDAEEIIEEFTTAKEELNKFYNKTTPEFTKEPEYDSEDKTKLINAGVKSRYLYQYDPEKQSEFYDPAGKINRSLSSIEDVLMEKYQKLTQMDVMVSTPETPDAPPQIIPNEEPKPSIPERILGRKPKKKGGVHSAFALELKAIDKIKQLKDDWYGHIDYHSYGVELHEEEPADTMKIYLSPEKTEFNIRVSKIETVFEQRMMIETREASRNAKDILTASVKLDQAMALKQ